MDLHQPPMGEFNHAQRILETDTVDPTVAPPRPAQLFSLVCSDDAAHPRESPKHRTKRDPDQEASQQHNCQVDW
jgi:hypothetical protein